ncbi:MAG: S1 RNA-binding domain-containing protein [Patescibacteria group bacterium]|nr:S1 RNA-binding domain-containing protein [Patescibacteria group bacterium]
MEEKKNLTPEQEAFAKLLEKDKLVVPGVGEAVRGTVLAASKAEVRLDIGGILVGVVRGPELYGEADEYANLKPGDEVDATVVDLENEHGELELSFRIAGQEKAWDTLRDAYKDKTTVKVKVIDGNKGGLLVRFRQISGFLPVSQLAPENYPRVSGGDKSKILEKLKSFVGMDMETKVMTLDENENKIIFSEKEAWSENQKDVISKYQVGAIVEGEVTAVTDFGVFVSFGENMEGLIHISELAWKRIDNPSDLYKVGDAIKAEIININGSKIFLSAKKLMTDPWAGVAEKYKVGQIVKSKILKVNPFGLFVELDELIHGLAHISQLGLAAGQKIEELYKAGTVMDFEITSIEPKEHRLGLQVMKPSSAKATADKEGGKKKTEKTEKKEEIKEEKAEKVEEKSEEKAEKKEKKAKKAKKPADAEAVADKEEKE